MVGTVLASDLEKGDRKQLASDRGLDTIGDMANPTTNKERPRVATSREQLNSSII